MSSLYATRKEPLRARGGAPRRRGRALALAAAAAMLGGAAAALADDSCATARDGTCDELRTCRLGTDGTDCAAACAVAPPRALAGPCAHLAQLATLAPPPVGPDTGSHGKGGPIGLWSGSVRALGTRPGTMVDRFYTVYVPRTYQPARPTPLILYHSGNGVDAYSLPWFHELIRAADLLGFILVSPEQPYINAGPDGFYMSWIIYTSNWQSGDWKDNPEVDFVRRLIGDIKGRYNVDRTRIVATGHSRGAALSIALAFELPDLIASFVSEMGFIRPQRYDERIKAIWKGGRRPPGILMHGRIDDNVQFSQSEYVVQVLGDLGWKEGDDLVFYRFDNVGHDWQRHLNQQLWDFVVAHPMPLAQAAP